MNCGEACEKIEKKLRLYGIDPDGTFVQEYNDGHFVATLHGHSIWFDSDLMVVRLREAAGSDQFDSLLHALRDMVDKEQNELQESQEG